MTPEEQAAADAARAAEEAAAAAGGGDDETKAELERTRIALKAANKEAADRRKRVEQLEAAETARQQAEMTETDRLKAEVETAKSEVVKAQQKARETIIGSAFVSEAAKVGASHPEDVARLADLSGVEVDETGKVTGVAEAVKALVDAGRIPLSGKAPAPNLDGGAGGGDRGKPAVKLSAEEIEIARKLNITPEKYQAQKAAIQARQEK